MGVIRAAAPGDPEIGALWSRIQTEFHANQRAVVESLNAKGALDPRLDVDEGADILWALNHPSLYELLVGERGWRRGSRRSSAVNCSPTLIGLGRRLSSCSAGSTRSFPCGKAVTRRR